jgi:cytochrome c556
MKHAMLAAIIGGSTLFASGTASAQAKPENVIKYRKALMVMQANSLRPIAGMVKGQRPYDKDIAIRNAAMLELTGKMLMETVAAGSDKGAETRAKPEIWSDAAGYKKAADNFTAEATKLAEASKAGGVDALRAQLGSVIKACDSCHDNYRSK